MIDQAVIERDARSNISDWPVTIRFNGREIVCGLSSNSDVFSVLEGATLDDFELQLMAIVTDFGGQLPEHLELIELKLRDGTWKECEVRRRPDAFDPISPTVQLVIGDPAK